MRPKLILSRMLKKELIEEKVKQTPIQLPGNPFWEVLRVFGRDEMTALLVSTLSTFLVSLLSSNPIILSLTGPVIEKIGFFLPYLKNRSFNQGFSSLVKDLVLHDPIYAVLMYWGLTHYSATPVWVLAIFSFTLAVFLASAAVITYQEISYQVRSWNLQLNGFSRVSYLEARF